MKALGIGILSLLVIAVTVLAAIVTDSETKRVLFAGAAVMYASTMVAFWVAHTTPPNLPPRRRVP